MSKKSVDQICGEVYRARLDKCDQNKVTESDCRKRGQIYRTVVNETLKAINYVPAKTDAVGDIL